MIHLTNQESKAHGDHHSTDNGAIHLALMIWFIGMNNTRVMECTSLYYKLKNKFIPKDNLDPYWQFVYCARRVLGKAMKSSPLLRPFCVSKFWGFFLLKI